MQKVLATFVLALVACRAADAPPPERWHYGNVERWAELEPAYEAARHGTRQSPIALAGGTSALLADVEPSYASIAPEIVDDGRSVGVNVPDGSWATIDGDRYQLLSFHFHTPSEHTLDGRRFAAEVHLIHRTSRGRTAVIAVFIEEGASNPALATVLANLPSAGDTRRPRNVVLSPADLLPEGPSYLRYNGSLTRPPCTEDVLWTVMEEPVTAGADELRRLRERQGENARPLQPANGRFVLRH